MTPTQYLHTFTAVVCVLALARCAVDAYQQNTGQKNAKQQNVAAVFDRRSSGVTQPPTVKEKQTPAGRSSLLTPHSSLNEAPPHPIVSVPSYKDAFPDSNAVQLASAQQHGVPPVASRADAEKRKHELVYVGADPYYHIDPMRQSIPYLVPRAATLLHDIGRAFYDSLYAKGVLLHQPIITSVLRTEEDVAKLKKHNGNASDNSCHRFGTTFDMSYNRYHTVQTAARPMRTVRNDTLKWILAEVLRDQRQQGRCHVKYEVKQGCFHITVK